MAEHLVFKGKLVWFGLNQFSFVSFGFGCCSQLRRSYKAYIPKFGKEMAENLAFKGKFVWFGFELSSMV